MNWIDSLRQDLQFGLRMLARRPGFSAIVVLTLAIGVGTTAAVFALIHGVLLTPPPYREPGQLVLVSSVKTNGTAYSEGCTTAQILDWSANARSFQKIAAYRWTFNYLILPNGSASIEGMRVTSDYFDVLGIKPLIGRTFLREEASISGYANGQTRTTTPIILLGYDLWHRHFGGDTNIVGKTLRISRYSAPINIIGVMPPGIRFLPAPSDAAEPNYDLNARVDFWMPASPDRSRPNDSDWHLVGRLKDNVALPQCRAELAALSTRQAQVEKSLAGLVASASHLGDELNRDGKRLLLPMFGAVALVFLIACANVAGLLLARGLQRQQEYGVRCALGAGRDRLFRQVLTENGLPGIFGGIAGALLAAVIINVLKKTSASAIPRMDAVTIGWASLVFCLLAGIIAAAVAGVFPAFRASQLGRPEGLKGIRASSAGRAERRLIGGVAIFQTALTLALLVGAGLLVQTLRNLGRVRPGYEVDKVLTMSVTEVTHTQPIPGLTDAEITKGWNDFHVQALNRVATLPGVKKVAFVWGVPLTGNKWTMPIQHVGESEKDKLADRVIVPTRAVTTDYFAAMGIPILSGRDLRATDNTLDWKDRGVAMPGETPFAIVVNQALADRYFPNADPIGKKLMTPYMAKRPFEIVGVIPNTRTDSLTKTPEPEIYFSYWQMSAFSKSLVVRTDGDPRVVATAVEQELRAIDPSVAVERKKPMALLRDESVAAQMFAMRLLGGFSIVAVILALVGIYGVMSLSIGFRRREMAIRMAVGAQRGDILGLIFSEGIRLIAVSVILGIAAAIALGRFLGSLLFGVQPIDVVTLATASTIFGLLALAACLPPARRAARVETVEVFRNE